MDSYYRDRVLYPSAMSFRYYNRTWNSTKNVHCVRPTFRGSCNLYHTLKLLHVSLPSVYFDQNGNPIETREQPYWLVRIRNDSVNIRTTKQVYSNNETAGNSDLNTVTFPIFFDRVQSDAAGNAIYVIFRPNVDQTLIFDASKEMEIDIFDPLATPGINTGDTLPPQGPTRERQVIVFFSITPYERTNEYSNHYTTLNSQQ